MTNRDALLPLPDRVEVPHSMRRGRVFFRTKSGMGKPDGAPGVVRLGPGWVHVLGDGIDHWTSYPADFVHHVDWDAGQP